MASVFPEPARLCGHCTGRASAPGGRSIGQHSLYRLSRCALTDAGPALTEHIRTTSSAARPWTSSRPSLTQP
jgi:hypothetical protein